ncbi:MAG: hypothetical protein IIY33_06710 [Erysipelotrichaceae bacterium]|nr:hypothetical protein [Erysipelotrichaceae bacterium]
MKKIICLLLSVLFIFSVTGCKFGSDKEPKVPTYDDFVDNYHDKLPENAEDGLTLHAFCWTYNQVKDNLESIANAGFKNVLLMPVQQPKSGGSAWWAFYQPLSFSIGDKSALGTKQDLIDLCREADKYNICILADVVVNHMATTDDEGKEPDGTPTVLPAVAEYEPVLYANRNEDTDGNGVTFHHNRNASGSGAETQYYPYGNLPDLNTANPYVQGRVLALLEECIDVGIDGFRFDAAKHVETSGDPDYASDFWETTVGVAKQYYKLKTGKNLYVYGEILNSPANRPLSLYTDMMRITDDGFVAQYKSCISKKDATMILNAVLKDPDPSKLIAWVESHDEYVSSNTHYTDARIAKYWSVVAGKKDLGGLYLARPTAELTVGKIGSYAFESEQVAIANRFRNRFYAAESYESAEGELYVNEKILPLDQGALIVNVGEINTGKTVEVKVPHLDNGNYYDALTGYKVVVSNHIAYVRFDANGVSVITRTKDIHPQLTVSDRDCTFKDDMEVILTAQNFDEGYYWFNNNTAERTEMKISTHVFLADHVEDGRVDLHVYLKKGVNELNQCYSYTKVEVSSDKFNVINLNPSYLNGDYELYIWSWSPGRWSKDYEIKDGILYVDTEGMTGFLLAIFEKGYEITDTTQWDSNVIKQSYDIKGDVLLQGYADMSGF